MADTTAESLSNMSLQAPEAKITAPADSNKPPGRVRAMFKKMDTDSSGALSIEEIKRGFTKEFEVLKPHVEKKIDELFEAKASADDNGKKVLKGKVFSRFFAEVLFCHFDADSNGTLELAEFEKAIGFMVKPDKDGNKTLPSVAFPPEFVGESGKVHLPMQWFWVIFSGME